MSNKKLSRRAEKPCLSHWRQKEKARTLGGYPPKGLLSPCSGGRCRTSAEFSLFSFSEFLCFVCDSSSIFLRSVVCPFFLECSPIYRLFGSHLGGFMGFYCH